MTRSPPLSLTTIATLAAALLASCDRPPTDGVYLRRERYGAVILHLFPGQDNLTDGDVTFTRVKLGGGIQVSAHKLVGLRDGNTVRMHDERGAAIMIAFDKDGADMTVPDGSVVRLDRADTVRENALLAGLNDAAARRRGGRLPAAAGLDAPHGR